MAQDETNVQEILVKLKFSPDTNIHKRTFAWRRLNGNALWMVNLSIDKETNEVSFTSEFNMEYSKQKIVELIEGEDLYFTSGEGLSLKMIKPETVEIKEEAEIYGNK